MRSPYKLLAVGLLPLSLAACVSDGTAIYSTPTKLQIMQPADPAPVRMSNVSIRVVTKDNMESFIDEQEKAQGNKNPVFIVMSAKDYQSISLNLAELKRYIDQQNKIIVYYRKTASSLSQ